MTEDLFGEETYATSEAKNFGVYKLGQYSDHAKPVEDFRVVERRDDDKNGRDVGLLVYVNKETWDRLARLCRKTGGGTDGVVEEALKTHEVIEK